MSESFWIEPEGDSWRICWGPTLIGTVWSHDRAFAVALCDILEATRLMDAAGPDDAAALMQAVELHKVAWVQFRDLRQAGR